MDAVLIENVTKSFSAVRAVDDLCVRVPAGCVYGFLGPNGAGKTTTLRMMMDIIAPDSGSVSILGEPASVAARQRVGYMPEERGLYAKMNIHSVLRYMGAIKGLTGAQAKRAATEWLDRVGLSDRVGSRVRDLSRGMQQRLQFAATAIHDPELLILDEPFSGLDPVNLDQLKAIIVSMRDAGKTVIFSTHMMDQAEQLCDSILLINKGRVVLDGTLAEIRARRRSDTVEVELTGDADFVAALSCVQSVTPRGQRLEISLVEGADSRELLAALIDRVEVIAFQQKTPSLHEIFVDLVGGSDE